MRYLQLLVIDDEPALRQILSAVLVRAGHAVSVAENGEQALKRLAMGDIDVAICDIRMPDMSGLDVVSKAKEQNIDTKFLMMTAFASVDTAVDAMRLGVYDYIVKPIRNDDLINHINNLGRVIALQSENHNLRNIVIKAEGGLCESCAPAMQRVSELVNKVSCTNSTVLITGESGTGKTILAKRIHNTSGRKANAFVAVNCGAIPENLMESELFGHTKGAFTGAQKAKRGLFVEADQGTIFLDEVGELPLAMQVKLLHVIEDCSVRAVGSEQLRTIDVRVISATNKNLLKMVEEGSFREDLYFRLNIFNIHLPALKERREDIAPMTEYFITKHAKALCLGAVPKISEAALMMLHHYHYPGNVRELENIISRAMILAEDGEIEPYDLPDSVQASVAEGVNDSTQVLRERVRIFEKQVINKTLEALNGDRKLAAEQLGLGLSSLYRKLES